MRISHVPGALAVLAVLPLLAACSGDQSPDGSASPTSELDAEQAQVVEDATLRIDKTGDARQVDCSDPGNAFLQIDAEGATVTLQGPCPAVYVNADDVTLLGDGADYLDVTGDDASVDLQTSSWIFAKGSTGTYDVDALEFQLEVSGDDNTITYAGEPAVVEDTGTGNTITKG